jgi:hypothetical protein
MCLQTMDEEPYALSCLRMLNVARLVFSHQPLLFDIGLPFEHVYDEGSLVFRLQSMRFVPVTSLSDRASRCWPLPRRRGNKTELLP